MDSNQHPADDPEGQRLRRIWRRGRRKLMARRFVAGSTGATAVIVAVVALMGLGSPRNRTVVDTAGGGQMTPSLSVASTASSPTPINSASPSPSPSRSASLKASAASSPSRPGSPKASPGRSPSSSTLSCPSSEVGIRPTGPASTLAQPVPAEPVAAAICRFKVESLPGGQLAAGSLQKQSDVNDTDLTSLISDLNAATPPVFNPGGPMSPPAEYYILLEYANHGELAFWMSPPSAPIGGLGTLTPEGSATSSLTWDIPPSLSALVSALGS